MHLLAGAPQRATGDPRATAHIERASARGHRQDRLGETQRVLADVHPSPGSPTGTIAGGHQAAVGGQLEASGPIGVLGQTDSAQVLPQRLLEALALDLAQMRQPPQVLAEATGARPTDFRRGPWLICGKASTPRRFHALGKARARQQIRESRGGGAVERRRG